MTRTPLPRRRLLQLVGLASGTAALAGCVSANQDAPTDTTDGPLKADGGQPSGEITIVDDNTNQVFQASTIAAFEKQTGIKVKSYTQGNFNDLHDRYATQFAAQDATVDIVMTWAGWSAEFGQAGWLQELDPSAVPADLIQPALDAVSWRGVAKSMDCPSSPVYRPCSGTRTWHRLPVSIPTLSHRAGTTS